MRRHRSDIRLLVSLCVPLVLFPLQAAPWNEWLSANGGSGVEYRWIIGLSHACHTEFRDPVIAGTYKTTEISGVIDFDRTTLNGIERNAIQHFNITIHRSETSVGPDVACEQVNDVTIREIKRIEPRL